MPHFKPPHRPLLDNLPLVFLAGSIEMGKAVDWQTNLANRLLAVNPDLGVANPRREAWDPSWELAIGNPLFRGQVEWELDHIERADLVVFYFQPGTQSPITLLELGKHLERRDAQRSTLVCCPTGFWRKGNVDIICQRAGLPLPFEDLEALARATEAWAMQLNQASPLS